MMSLRSFLLCITEKQNDMDYQELIALQNSKENKAVENLMSSINSTDWNSLRFGRSVAMQHRTLQQSLMKSFIAMIRIMASDNYSYDLRNKASHELAKRIVESGVLEDDTLPFI